MTDVEFQFNFPGGEPITDTEFVIKLAKSGFVPELDGILMPADTTFTTDAEGRASVPLAPSDSPYTVRMTNPKRESSEDSCSQGINYRFYVPISEEPVRAQDLLLNPPPTNLPYDQAAIQAINEAKATSVSAAQAAAVSAEAAEASTVVAAETAVTVEGTADEAIRARDSSEAFAIDALGATTQTSADRIAARQAALESGNAAASQVKVLTDELAEPPGSGKVGHRSAVPVAVARTVASKVDETISALDLGLTAGASDALRAAMQNANYLQPMMYGTYRRLNGTSATVGVSDEANFAGQSLESGIPIGWVKHHYTDGNMMQMDNVGKGTILVLKNARNPVRRADRPNEYVGEGSFLSLNEHDYEAGYSKGMFYISKAAEFVWTGVKGVASFMQNKAEDGLFAFQMRTTKAHRYFLRILNGGNQICTLENDVDYTRVVVKSSLPQTNGMVISTEAGRLRLDCAGSYIELAKPVRGAAGNLLLGTVLPDTAVESQVPFKPRGYAALANLPNAVTFVGCIVMCGGIPVYANGGIWRYVRDDQPVV